ncbi:MAG: sensor histidine kinase [Sulfuricaulis sp.]
MFHTTGFRYALLYIGLFGASVLVLYGVVYWNTAGYMERQLKDVIDAEVQSLNGDFQEGGIDDLHRSIDDRIASDSNRQNLYLLLASNRARIAGNLATRNAVLGWQEATRVVSGPKGPEDHLILGRGVSIPNGNYLFVGQDAYQLKEIRGLMISAFGWAFLMVVVLAVGGGLVMSVGLLHRVDVVNRTAQEIVHGDLSRRIPTRGTNDEFDQLATNLNHMLVRIQSLMDELRQVSNDIAHDLRTPLGRLRQRLESVRLKARTIEEYETAVDRAIVDTDAILETFTALLRIAQVESGSRRSKFTDVDLSQLLCTVVETYAPVAEDCHHRLISDIAPNIRIRGDSELLTQMFANLIENALTHSPSDTEIQLLLQPFPDGLEVVIADRGPGIPESERERVFQRFYRLDTSRATPGSGLGLALVAAIAELHGLILTLSDNQPGLRFALRFTSVCP